MLRRVDKAPTLDGIRFFKSVSFRLLAGLSIVAVLSIASIVAAILTLRVTASSNDEIASSELPYLSAASQLSQNANLVASAAHTLATAQTEFQLRTERNKVDETLNILDGFLEEIRLHGESAPLSVASSGELFDLIQQRRNELVANIDQLNAAVAARISLQNRFTKEMLDLRSTMADVGGVDVDALGPNRGYLKAWTRNLGELAGNVFSLPILTSRERIEQTRARVEETLDTMSGELGRLNVGADSLLDLKWQTVREQLLGDETIFDTRLELIALERSIARTLSEGSFVSRRFVSAVSTLFFDVQAEFDQTNRRVSTFVNRVQTTLALTGGVTVVLIVLLVLFVRHSVVERLTQLKNAIQHHFEGEKTDIPTKGTDELAEIGRALAYFVAEISEREERLVQSRQEAEAANAAKSEFLAVVSHELRTPMYGVLAMGRFLLESDLNEEQRDSASSIIQSGEDLLTILNDILDFSRIEAGKLDLDITEFDLLHEIDTVDSLISRSALPKGLELNVAIGPEVPQWLVGDAGRIRQVLINLAGNAVKFTEKGEVRLAVSASKSPERSGGRDECTLRFTVSDTGVGIDDEKQRTLFEPFTQADTSTARQYGGTGLGLSISRRLVDLMGGTIEVESEPGRGSTFTFDVPCGLVSSERIEELAAAEDATSVTDTVRYRAPDPDPAREANAVVLVAEDNATNRKIIDKLMARLGYVFDIVENGQDAWEAYCKKHYGLVLTDCRMPIMDGFEFAARVREHERDSPSRTPIIALTADALQQTKEHCQRVGMDDTLTKPVDFADLDKAICQWLPAAAQLRTPIDEPATIDGEPGAQCTQMKVLDLTPLREAFGEIDDDALALLGEFIESAEAKIGTIMECIDKIDTGELVDLTHSLKGESLNLGATRFGRLLEEFEVDMREAASLSNRKPAILREWQTLIEAADRLIGRTARRVGAKEMSPSASSPPGQEHL